MIGLPLSSVTPRRHLYFDCAVLATATAGMLATLLGWGDNPVRVAAGLVLSLFSPGYALIKALFRKYSCSAEDFGLSVPLSIVLAILVGAVVNNTPFGLSGNLIVLLLWVCTVVLMAVAYARLSRSRTSRQEIVTKARVGSSSRISIAAAAAAVLVVIAGAAWATNSVVAASRTQAKPFTALSVNGGSGIQQAGQPLTVTLDNQEGQPMVYDLEVRIGGTVVTRTEGVRLESGAQYSLALPLLSGVNTGADVVAFRSGASEPYRTVHVGGPEA